MGKNKQYRIFIVGGLGYIGSVLAKKLVEKGHWVFLYDSLLYEQNRHKIMADINYGQPEGHGAELIIGDHRNLNLLNSTIENCQPDYIFHLGELSSVYACGHNPAFTQDINFNGSKNVVDICAKKNIPLIYNSTSSLYGSRASQQEMKEDDYLPEQTDNYCRSKLAMEKYITEKKRQNLNFRAIILRPATVCGLSPRLRLELLPNHFTYCALAKKEIKISEPDAYRATIDIRDLVSAYCAILQKTTWDYLVYNLGYYNLNKKEFAERIQNIIPCKIIEIPNIGDSRNLKIDSTRFYREFNFKPQFSYEESIKDIAGWLGANLTQIEQSNFAGLINMPLEKWLKII